MQFAIHSSMLGKSKQFRGGSLFSAEIVNSPIQGSQGINIEMSENLYNIWHHRAPI